MSKDDLRREILAARKIQAESHVSFQSEIIMENLVKLDSYSRSEVVALYYPFRNEVNLLPLLESGNKTFVFPKVVKKTRKLDFYNVSSVGDFKKGAYGIMEPDNALTKVDVGSIDLFAVPGVAFSSMGERIGYGGGYYDCTLSYSRDNSVSVGIAFNIQIVDPGFSEHQDIPVDILITEKKHIFVTIN